ncbi:MAG: hypothetical protein FJ125_05955 [Deltaproteobacteria bacterium]|nr:hypothetical protein [Deltaproteobacteria bacterium]
MSDLEELLDRLEGQRLRWLVDCGRSAEEAQREARLEREQDAAAYRRRNEQLAGLDAEQARGLDNDALEQRRLARLTAPGAIGEKLDVAARRTGPEHGGEDRSGRYMHPEYRRILLEFWRLCYEADGNPLYIWHVRRLARWFTTEWGDAAPCPGWVEAELDQVAARLLAGPVKGRSSWVAGALGLASKSGPSLLRQHRNRLDDLSLWSAGRWTETAIAAGWCPSCQPGMAPPGCPCRGSGQWARWRRKKSVNMILAEKHGLAEETVKKARGRVNRIMSRIA